MLRTIFTLDYEVHGNGDGCPLTLMIEPTARLLRMFDTFGAKLTIMADVAEIIKFKQYAEFAGRDDFQSGAIERQLQQAIRTGHDVQLHIHPSYFRAQYDCGRWNQDWSEYDFAILRRERMDWMIKQGKDYLESLLRPINTSYRCEVFRAANWAVSPSTNVVEALIANGIRIDTSVYKYGRRTGLVQFDYTSAVSEFVPWRVAHNDICKQDDNGHLWEFPIYSEARSINSFVTPQRLYRALVSRSHKIPIGKSRPDVRVGRKSTAWTNLFGLHAWKADFNQCTGRQLIAALERARAKLPNPTATAPLVLIGHSKLFSRFNERSLRPLLTYVQAHTDHFQFGKFTDFNTARTAPEPTPIGILLTRQLNSKQLFT